MGRGNGLRRTTATRGENVYCLTGWHCQNAASTIPCVYVPGLMAVVLRARLRGHEAWRKLGHTGEILPSVRRGDWGIPSDRLLLVCVEPLEEPHARRERRGITSYRDFTWVIDRKQAISIAPTSTAMLTKLAIAGSIVCIRKKRAAKAIADATTRFIPPREFNSYQNCVSDRVRLVRKPY